jgi:hypothetical protein
LRFDRSDEILAEGKIEAESRKELRVSGHRHNEVFVKIHDEGWAVSKPNAERASGVFETQAEAIERAQELAGNGTIHIQGRHGKFRKLTVFEED